MGEGGPNTAGLALRRDYITAKERYSVRFFPEDARGEERRPDGLKEKGITEAWELEMPLELELYRTTTRRLAMGLTKARGMDAYTNANDTAQVRAVAAALWVEKQPGYPFKETKKRWKADELLSKTADLNYKNRRHAALVEFASRLIRAGVRVHEGTFDIQFGSFSVERFVGIPIPGLVEGLDIPAGVLARLDGAELDTEEKILEWLSTLFTRPKLTRALIEQLAEALLPLGVKLGAGVYSINTPDLNIAAIKELEVPGYQNVELVLKDLLRMNGLKLEDEADLRSILETHWRESAVRETKDEKQKSKKVHNEEEEKEESVNGTVYTLLQQFAHMKMSIGRRREIEKLAATAPLVTFKEEVARGFQSYLLNQILTRAGHIHRYKEEDVLELLGRANLVLTRRMANVDAGPLHLVAFVKTCVSSAISDAGREGLVDGVNMSGPVERLMFRHHDKFTAALNASGAETLEVTLPAKEEGTIRTRRFQRDEVEAALEKFRIKRAGTVSLNSVKHPNGESHPALEGGLRTVASSLSPFSDANLSQRRDQLLAELKGKVLGHLDERLGIVVWNELCRQMGLPNCLFKDIATQFGVTESRISQLASSPRAQNAIKSVMGELRSLGRQNVALLLGITEDLEESD